MKTLAALLFTILLATASSVRADVIFDPPLPPPRPPPRVALTYDHSSTGWYVLGLGVVALLLMAAERRREIER